jgi:hypothetical protein
MRYFYWFFLGTGLASAQSASAQSAVTSPPTRTVEHLVVVQAHALTGNITNTTPVPERYFVIGAGGAYRNRWHETNADYSTNLTIGFRYGVGRARRPSYYANGPELQTALRGTNLFVAADGRYVGGSLGMWLGQLGQVSFKPQARLRVGRLDSFHAFLDYAEDFTGFMNPPVRLGSGLRFPESPLTVLVGAAIPTLAPEGSEVQGFARIGLHLGKTFDVGAYLQPAFSKAATHQLSFSLGYVP